MKILYITSTLRRSGPTNQLYSLVSHLKTYDYDIAILTLSPEPINSRLEDFNKLGIKVETLSLSRMQSLLIGRKSVENYIKSNSPFDIIHTQGIRADSLVSKISGNFKWVLTSHNNPYLDYVYKFGKIRGPLMAWNHAKVLNSCENVIACSLTNQKELLSKNIKSKAIPNGLNLTEVDKFLPKNLGSLERPIFITVGSLIERKNMISVVIAFNKFKQRNKGTLLVVGDGPDKAELEEKAGENILFTGNVSDVPSYLKSSDVFISASKSEGLPYTVLEALAADLPLILSDIPSHKEIASETKSCRLFRIEETANNLYEILEELRLDDEDLKGSRQVAENVFSARIMASNYHEVYQNLVGR